MRRNSRGEELEKELKEARAAALKDLIDRQLIIQAFKKEKFQIPDHFVEQQVRGIIKENIRWRSQYLYQDAPGAELFARRIQTKGDRKNDRAGDAAKNVKSQSNLFPHQNSRIITRNIPPNSPQGTG